MFLGPIRTHGDQYRTISPALRHRTVSQPTKARVLKGYIDTLNGYFTNGSAKTALEADDGPHDLGDGPSTGRRTSRISDAVENIMPG